MSKELNHLAAILHVCAGGLIFMMKKNESTPRTLTLHLVIDTTRTRAILSRSRFEAALVCKPPILRFKKESRNNGRSEA